MRNTTPIICAKAPRHIVYVPAVRRGTFKWPASRYGEPIWECSWCGARVKVVA